MISKEKCGIGAQQLIKDYTSSVSFFKIIHNDFNCVQVQKFIIFVDKASEWFCNMYPPHQGHSANIPKKITISHKLDS